VDFINRNKQIKQEQHVQNIRNDSRDGPLLVHRKACDLFVSDAGHDAGTWRARNSMHHCVIFEQYTAGKARINVTGKE
jgi:hypothetical protein